VADRGRVAVVSRLDVVLEQFAHDRQGAGEFVHDRHGLAGGPFRIADAHAFADLLLEAADDGVEALGGEVREGAVEDGVVVVQAGKQELEQVFADLSDGAL
jgi:hypothetical protein